MRVLCTLLLTLAFTTYHSFVIAETHDEAEHGEPEKGSHGGRLLHDDTFAVELAIFESGVEPEFRAYAFSKDEPLDPKSVDLEVVLTRLAGTQQRFAFSPRGDYLLGDGVVREPHSFVVDVTATHQAKSHRWKYDSFEGRTSIDAASAAAAGIVTETAGPATIRETLILHGIVVPDPSRVYRLHARFPGVVKEVRKRLGDAVTAGEVLVVIEANDSLQRYNVVAPSAGIVVDRDVNPGMTAQEGSLITVADLSTVWVELAAFQHDLDAIAPGQTATIRDVDGHQSAMGSVDTIASVGSPASQSTTARIVLPNPDGRWRPGLFVTGEIVIAEAQVPLAVRRSALQTFRDWTIVLQQVGDEYEVRPLTLGRGDAERVEVVDGLDVGARYVTIGSYLVKADVEKSGAAHDH